MESLRARDGPEILLLLQVQNLCEVVQLRRNRLLHHISDKQCRGFRRCRRTRYDPQTGNQTHDVFHPDTPANRDSQYAKADLASRRLESKSKFADERQDQFAGRHSVVRA